MKKLVVLLTVIFSLSIANAQSITGKWKTIDDETGKAKSIVEIYKKDGKLYGKIVKLLNPKEENPKCTKCPDYRKNKPILGMNIITGLTPDDNEWEGDDAILDPEAGKLYDCKIWLDENDPNKLNVRGYIGFFFRTQTWYRVK
jgi:uncharacterized protein (DUF2147 family)